MRELRRLIVDRNDDIPLDIAALDMASIEYPGIDPAPFLEILDSHARELSSLAPPTVPGDEWLEAARRYFGELGFRGNQNDYYHPSNSCLNAVLTDRTGLPITLALVWMEVARRLDRPVVGIGLPGHFLVAYLDDGFTGYVDCFNGGGLLTVEECREMAMKTAKVDIFVVPSLLRPVGRRSIAMRMLLNLRAAYMRSGDQARLRQVERLLLDAGPV